MFIVQSGPIRSSLVALSTRTVAEEDEEEEEEENGEAISLLPFRSASTRLKRGKQTEQTRTEITEGLLVCR